MRNPGHTSLGQVGARAMSGGNIVLAAGVGTDNTLTFDANATFWPQRLAIGGGAPGFHHITTQLAGAPGSFAVTSTAGTDIGTIRTFMLLGAGMIDGPAGAASRILPHFGGGSIGEGGTSQGVQVGAAVLAGGTATVATRQVPSGARFMLYHRALGGVAGHLSLGAIAAGNPGSFVINSSNAGDTSTIQYAIIDPLAMVRLGQIGHSEGAAFKALQVIRATIVAGTVAIPGTFKNTSQTGLFVQRVTPGGVLGFLTVAAPVAGDPGSCTVTSSDAGDTSIVDLFVWRNEAFGQSL